MENLIHFGILPFLAFLFHFWPFLILSILLFIVFVLIRKNIIPWKWKRNPFRIASFAAFLPCIGALLYVIATFLDICPEFYFYDHKYFPCKCLGTTENVLAADQERMHTLIVWNGAYLALLLCFFVLVVLIIEFWSKKPFEEVWWLVALKGGVLGVGIANFVLAGESYELRLKYAEEKIQYLEAETEFLLDFHIADFIVLFLAVDLLFLIVYLIKRYVKRRTPKTADTPTK